MSGKKKYIETFGSFTDTEPFNCLCYFSILVRCTHLFNRPIFCGSGWSWDVSLCKHLGCWCTFLSGQTPFLMA